MNSGILGAWERSSGNAAWVGYMQSVRRYLRGFCRRFLSWGRCSCIFHYLGRTYRPRQRRPRVGQAVVWRRSSFASFDIGLGSGR